MSVDQIVSEAQAMPQAMAIELVDRLLEAVLGAQDPEHVRAWSKTIHQRISEVRSGEVALIPGEATASKIRQIVGR